MMNENEVQEIHLFVPSADYQLPEKQGKNKIQPCYLDVCSGFVDFSDDSLDGSPGIRKLYYGEFTTKARPDILTFSTCPHSVSYTHLKKILPQRRSLYNS